MSEELENRGQAAPQTSFLDFEKGVHGEQLHCI